MRQAGAATAEHHARHSTTVLFLSVVLATAGILATQPSSAQEGIAIPAPVLDTPVRPVATETAVVAGGCFWGVQGVFQHVTGVTNAVSGYAGGEKQTAHYEMIGSGTTGHAEAVEITYDPSRISYGKILQIFFAVAHDPTQLNRQGPDIGTQYRTAIFPRTRSRPTWPRPISRNSTRRGRTRRPSSRGSSRIDRSTGRRTITRIS